MRNRAIGSVGSVLISGLAAWMLTPACRAEPEVNVALRQWGLSSARASSVYGTGYAADNVLDGRWSVRETDKWNSAANATPHWLAIDLGRSFTIDRLVVRHEGAIADGNLYNTSDFRLQQANAADGPWVDIVPRVRDNRDDTSIHDFPRVTTRYVRLLIEKGEPNANEYARIAEVEVYAPVSTLSAPLADLAWAKPGRLQMAGNRLQQMAVLKMAAAPGFDVSRLSLEVAGAPASLSGWNGQRHGEFWAPVAGAQPVDVTLRAGNGAGSTVIARRRLVPPGELYFAGKGTLNIVSSSHQDIAWMDDPDTCRLYRINECIAPALNLMAMDPGYCFVMENMLNLMEFLQAHPERKAEVQRLTREGRLEWGATYNQPYESMLSGEELVRETYFGRRWLRRNLPGCDARVAFNPDVPGRALQMQQILHKAGIPYLIMSRYHEGLFRWLSPDGTGVIAYSPGHYGNPVALLNQPPADAVTAISRKLDEQGILYRERGLPPAYCLLNSQDFARPTDFAPLIKLWNAQGAGSPLAPPKMQYSSARGFFDQVAQSAGRMETLVGERPDIWLYIHGPTHHEAISAKRDAARLLPAAETFSTIDSLLSGDFGRFPTRALQTAWMAALYPDHGWGGRNGHITDELFKHKAEFARVQGAALLDVSLRRIAGRVRTSPSRGTPIQVFNTLSWKRSDPVLVDRPAGISGSFRLIDDQGREVPCQSTVLEEPDEVNVSSSAMGAKAIASSTADPAHGPARAIDGRWSSLATDRWISAAAGPQWITVDFGRSRRVHKVVIRHEGSLGAYQDEETHNTSDFRVQASNSPGGPWSDLVPPISGNVAVLTAHTFAPRTFRFLRVYITKSAARDGEPARLFEVSAFARNEAIRPRMVFIAKDVPPIGYRTFYAVAGKPRAARPGKHAAKDTYENAFYRISLAPGGVRSIFDKTLGHELLDTGKFLGGEVFTMQSVGNGAGEFAAVQQPTMEGFDRLSAHRPKWRLAESGPVRTAFVLEQSLPTCTIKETLVVYNGIKRLDFHVSILNWNGLKYREFRGTPRERAGRARCV